MDDLRNAGAVVEDAPAVTDRNLVTGRVTADLPEFLKAVMRALAVGVAEEAAMVK
jgi:putative intracellular protease/amidase